MKKYILIAALIVAITLLGGRYFLRPSVDVIHPTRGPAVQAVYATGTVEASVMIPIATRSSGKLLALQADEGANVKKGQILAQLDDSDIKSVIAQLRATERFARAEYDRQIQLNKQGFNSTSTFQKAKTTWEAAKAAAEKAEADAGFMKLTAPADGLVIKRDGEVGQMIPAGQTVFWLSCCAPLRISTEVNEEDITLVQIGQTVLIRADAFAEQVFNGKVQAITPKGDPISRTYRVRVEFTDAVPLRIGMTAETNIIISKNENALLVPSSAVVNRKLWVVRNGILTQQEVQTGAKGLKQIEIISGVTAEDFVVAAPVSTLKAGESVRTHVIESK